MATSTDAKARPAGRIALISKTGMPRNRGSYVIPADNPIILDLADVDPRDLGEIEGDGHILSVRSDAEVTPASDIVRLKRS